jgi:hypothetical protein
MTEATTEAKTTLVNEAALGGWRAVATTATLVAAAVFFYPLWLDIPLLDPDEGIHAAIAQEMVDRGEWCVPQFRGQPFLDKPILFFWTQAASLWLFGESEAAVRLPGLLFGLLGTATTRLLAARLLGRSVGWVAALFYGTMVLPVALAQAAAHDVALVPWINLTILFLWQSHQSATARLAANWTIAAAVVLALSILTKGLVGPAIVATVFGSYLLTSRQLSLRAAAPVVAALALAVLLAGAWYLVVEYRMSGYLYYYFVERHLLGFATASQPHGDAPWWYYLPVLLGGGLPWITYLPVTIREQWAERAGRRTFPSNQSGQEKSGEKTAGIGEKIARANAREWAAESAVDRLSVSPGRGERAGGPLLLCWCWLVGGFLLLTLARSKMVTYLWPLFPSVAVLAAVSWSKLLAGTLSIAGRNALARNLVPSGFAAPLVLAIVLVVVQQIFALRLPKNVWGAVILSGVSAWIPSLLVWRGWTRMMFHAAVLSTVAQFVALVTTVLPLVAETTTAKSLAEHYNHQGHLPHRLLVAEERIGSLVFYLDAGLRAVLRANQLAVVRLDAIGECEPGTVLAISEQVVRRKGLADAVAGLRYQRAGRFRLYEADEFSQRLLLSSSAGIAVAGQK